jgi:hypothetical protein
VYFNLKARIMSLVKFLADDRFCLTDGWMFWFYAGLSVVDSRCI